MVILKGIYEDEFGREYVDFYSNGKNLEVLIRGMKFEGIDFETLTGDVDEDKFEYIFSCDSKGNIVEGDLKNYRLEVEIPITVDKENLAIKGLIIAYFDYREKIKEPICLELKIDDKLFVKNTKKFNFFEDAIIDLQKQFPKEYMMRICLFCKHSAYHPFGGVILHCLKNVKDELGGTNDKWNLYDLWKNLKPSNSSNIQETFTCPEHEFGRAI